MHKDLAHHSVWATEQQVVAQYFWLLGSQILPPSCVPEQNLMVLYVVHPGLSFASEWLLLCFQTSHLITPFTYFTSVHLLICHSSLIPPIFLYVHLIYLDFLWICISCVIFPVLPPLYLSLVLCILSSLEFTLLLSASLVLPLSPSHSCVFYKAAGVQDGLRPTGHLRSSVSSRSCSGSACGCMIVNSYQPDAFPTPDLPSLAMSRFLRNPNVTLAKNAGTDQIPHPELPHLSALQYQEDAHSNHHIPSQNPLLQSIPRHNEHTPSSRKEMVSILQR